MEKRDQNSRGITFLFENTHLREVLDNSTSIYLIFLLETTVSHPCSSTLLPRKSLYIVASLIVISAKHAFKRQHSSLLNLVDPYILLKKDKK